MVPLLAALVYRIRPQVSEVAGVLVATAGLGLMTLEGAIGSIGRGDLLTFFCAVAFAAHIVTLGHFSEQMSFELLSVTQVGAAAVLALVTVLVGGNAPSGVAPGGGLRDTGYRIIGHCSGVYVPGVGAAVHHLDPNGADLHAGAGFRLDDVVFVDGRGPFRARRRGRGPHPGRSGAGGIETVESAATSITIALAADYNDRLQVRGGVERSHEFL